VRTGLVFIVLVLWGRSLSPTARGAIIREWWLGIGGTSVADLTSDPRYPNDPDGRGLLDLFEGPTNWANDYGSRLYGWLAAPESGEYTFWIASDDSSQLYLSTDDDPAKARLIASVDGWTNSRQWNKFSSQRSQPIALQAGRKYYIEAIVKEGSGGDNVAVAWQPPGGVQEVISGRFVDDSVSPYASSPSPADGTVLVNAWASLSWLPGEHAALHEIYFGADKAAVAQRQSSALIAVTDEPSASVGLPGSSFPNGLPPGMIYYWCVDEVNDAKPESPWRGPVWSFQIPADPVAYLLITNTELASAFQPLVDRRTAQGYPGRLITVEDICSAYPGVDAPEQIRICVIDHYLNHGLSYVALGGDEGVVPVRYCFPTSVDEEIPADLYYADTDGGDWDADGNGLYGEVGDVGEIELTPDVHMGRIAVRTPEDVMAYFHKVVTYETASPEGFANSMLCLGNLGGIRSGTARWRDSDHHDPVTNTEWRQMLVYDSYIQPYWQAVPLHVLWDAYSSWDTECCGDYELTLDHVSERLNEGYHFVFYYGHAGSDGWAMLNGRRFTWSRVAALTNPIPSVIVSLACSPAGFDKREPCVSEAFLRNPNGGAVAYFGHTRTTMTPDPSSEHLFLAVCRDHARTTGEAMALAMTALASSRISYPREQYNFVLHGDPCIHLLREESGRHLQIYRPKGCEVIQQGSDLIIRWNAAGVGFENNEMVKLDYSADGGATWEPVLGAQSLWYKGGGFTWKTCPLRVGSHYRIRVSSLTDPSVTHMSERDFTIAQLCFLTVQSVPDANVVITGTYDGITSYDLTTDYDISVPQGTMVGLVAPWVSESMPELVFVRWTDGHGNTLTGSPDCTLAVSSDMTIVAEYSEPVVRHCYVNDEVPENGIASGDDSNDGCSAERPTRHIQALLDKYPNLGRSSVINVSAGTYDENIRLSGDNAGVEFIGAGPGLAIVDGQHEGPCVSLNGFRGGVISGFTMRDGAGTYGGGIWCVNSSVTIRDCVFAGNTTEAAGGAVYVDTSSRADISDCVFSRNSGYNGGAIANFASAEIRSCSFQANDATTFGGAIYAQSGQNMTRIIDCTFDMSGGYGYNSSVFGGALYIFGGTATIDSCVFEANHADRDGGAACGDRDCEAVFINCVFNGNAAGRYGGAIATRQAPSHASVTNCTFSKNSARYPGGALCDRGTLGATAMDCIFWGSTPDQIAGGVSISYCDVQGGWPGQGNINADPLFANPDGGDFHLRSRGGRWDPIGERWITDTVTSPCIDAGDPDSPVGEEPAPNGERINLGAYGGTVEASKSPGQ